MKKILQVVFVMLFTFSVFSQQKTSFVDWSLSTVAGVNYLEADIPQGLTQFFSTSVCSISSGRTFEYSLTPILGLSLYFCFFPHNASLSSNKSNNNIKTNFLTLNINTAINFTQ